MGIDKKLRKKIKEEFEKPSVPFEEWAKKHGVSLDKPSGGTVPEKPRKPRPVMHTKQTGIAVVRNSILSAVCLLAVVAMVISTVIITDLNRHILYGISDVDTVYISFDDLADVDNIYLPDSEKIVVIDRTSKQVLIDDSSFVLCYNIENALISFEDNSGVYAFYINYTIRVYEYFESLYFQKFENLGSTATVGDKSISYAIDESARSAVGFAHFTGDKNDYFIEARGFEGVTTLTNDNFVLLLENIFA